MATSFITKDQIHGFWIQDSLMQVVCWGLEKAIEESNCTIFSKNGFKEHLYNNSQGIFVGFMNLSLEDYVTDDNLKLCFIKVISDAKIFFQKKGIVIEPEELNAFQQIKETRKIWIESLEISLIIKVLVQLEDLINNRIKTTSDTVE